MTDGKDGDDPQPTESAGAVADEALRLVQTFTQWATDQSAAASARAAAEPQPGQRSCGCATSSSLDAVCRVCPVCRIAALVQDVRPELLDRVADVLGLVAGSLHSVAADRRDSATGDHGTDAAPPATDVPVTGDEDDDRP